MTFKHVVDWLVALAAATILMPVLLLISLLIVLDSRGSPIFRQRRIGYRGQPFVVWKFRTMSVTDNDDSGRSDARTAAMTARSEARRVGNECVRPCRYRWSPSHLKKKIYTDRYVKLSNINKISN